MPKTLTVYHDRHYDLVLDETPGESPEGKVTFNGKAVKSTGVFKVINREGVEEDRHRISVANKDNTTYIEVPDDFEPTPVALMHMVQMINERHAESEHITGLSGSDPQLTARVAALLGTEVYEEQA